MNKEINDIINNIEKEINLLKTNNTPLMRKIRKKYSKVIENKKPEFVYKLAIEMIKIRKHRWFAYELVRNHKETFERIEETQIEELGEGINSWWSVDSFARTLSGPLWLKGNLKDEQIYKWALSEDLWWRRAALVSTVALNQKSDGGKGEPKKTLKICKVLVNDKNDMIIKAMSWALRALAIPKPEEVKIFLKENDKSLASRIKREVNFKLKTGLKNPKKKRSDYVQ